MGTGEQRCRVGWAACSLSEKINNSNNIPHPPLLHQRNQPLPGSGLPSQHTPQPDLILQGSLVWKPSLPGLRRSCCVQITTSHKFGSSKWSLWEAELHSGISNSLFKSPFHFILYIPFPPPAPEASLTTTLTLVRIGPGSSSPLRSGTQ